jgi:cyclophilin family peptidyl-prolyl cis-trans isomerase
MRQNRFVKIIAILFSMTLCLSGLSACKGDSTVERNDDGAAGGAAVTDSRATTVPEGLYTEDVEIKNFIMPTEGEDIAVITVKDYGVIKVKLFPVEAEKGVENFVGLANIDYYDELIFHRVIKDFMNQGGDPRGNGTGGNSMWGDKFDGGIPEGLYHFSGAIAYANSGGPTTNVSQFYIVNTPEGYVNAGGYTDANGQYATLTDLDQAGISMPANVAAMYKEKGGVPFLDGGYTVFGQVFEGLDVVRAIGDTPVDGDDKPLTQVLIESIEIVPYSAG